MFNIKTAIYIRVHVVNLKCDITIVLLSNKQIVIHNHYHKQTRQYMRWQTVYTFNYDIHVTSTVK